MMPIFELRLPRLARSAASDARGQDAWRDGRRRTACLARAATQLS